MERPALQRDWRDLLAVLLLTLTCLVLRLPVLDRIGLNPDESQYEATAAYLLATDTSAFALPYGTPTTYTLYKVVAAVFGPYAMFEVRVLLLLLCLGMALLLYAIVRTRGGPWAGLLAGLVLVHYNVHFEGHAANREWLVGLCLLAGIYLYTRSTRADARRLPWLFAAGAVSGVALWFKYQVAYMVLVIPLVLVWEAYLSRSAGRVWRDVAAFATGGGLSAVLHFLPFALRGSFGGYLDQIATRFSRYAAEGDAAFVPAESGALRLFFDRFFWELPGRPMLLVCLALVGLCLAGITSRLLRGRRPEAPLTDSPLVLLFSLYLVTAVLSIRMGGRYFDHYYLLMVPACAGLVGLGFAGCAAIAGRRARAAVLGVLILVAAGVVVQGQTAAPPRSLALHDAGFDELVREIESRAGPGDRLFVWGWCPEIYSLTRLEPSSHFAICQYIVNDYRAVPEPSIEPELAALLLHDLETRPPRFVVDATRRSYTMSADHVPWIYRLDLYPDFALVAFLESHYRYAGRFDDCDLYVRR